MIYAYSDSDNDPQSDQIYTMEKVEIRKLLNKFLKLWSNTGNKEEQMTKSHWVARNPKVGNKSIIKRGTGI